MINIRHLAAMCLSGTRKLLVSGKTVVFCLAVLQLLSGGCRDRESLSSEVEQLGRATGPVESSARAQSPPIQMPPGMKNEQMKIRKGRVLETIDVSRYTYLKLAGPEADPFWVAVQKEKVEVGQDVEIIESIVMKDFSSPTLKRTFPTIVFGILKKTQAGERDVGVGDGTPPEPPAGHPPVGAATESPR